MPAVPRLLTFASGRLSVHARLRLRTARLGGNLRPLTRTLRRLLFSVLFRLGLEGRRVFQLFLIRAHHQHQTVALWVLGHLQTVHFQRNTLPADAKEAPDAELSRWKDVAHRVHHPKDDVNIAIVGKYVEYEDSYKSLKEALTHGAISQNLNIDPKVRAEELSLFQWIALANFIAPPPCPDMHLTHNERFPVVDKNDQILGETSRFDVHANNLRHRAVHILIFNPAGEVYLQQRSRWKDRHPLKWDSSAAGHVGAAESYDETAQRELKEELGITVRLEKISKLPASERTDQEFVWLYRGEVAGNLSPNRTEIETGAFFSQTVIDGWIAARPKDFAPGFIECWKVYRQKGCSNRSVLT